MAMRLSISEVRRRLPSLADEVASRRQEILITRRGKPLARLVPCYRDDTDTESYPLRGLPIEIADDFDDPLTGLWESITK